MGRAKYQVYKKPDREHYRVRFTIRVAGRSKRFERSTGESNRRQAEKVAARLYGAATQEAEAISPAGYKSRLDELLAMWLAEMYRNRSNEWASKLEQYAGSLWLPRWNHLDQINAKTVSSYICDRLGSVSGSTVNKELVGLRRFLKWCKRNGYLEVIPEWDNPPRDTDYKPECLTPEQVDKIIARLSPAPAAFYRVMYDLAARRSTMARITWEDIDFTEKTVNIRASADKSRYSRKLPLTPKSIKALKGVKQKTGPIFGYCDYRKQLADALADLGITCHVTAHHTFRHSRLTELAAKPGATIAAVQYVAGHKTLVATQRYIHGRYEMAKELMK